MRYTSNVLSYLSAHTTGNMHTTMFRQPTLGPELDVVNMYCQGLLADHGGNEALTIFLEPKLESGFPDIVAVFWDPTVAQKWPLERSNLLSTDIPIVHHINISGRIPVEMLVKRFGTRKASGIMLRLSDAQVADVRSDEILRFPLQATFAVKRIVAIEAKVKDWRNGLNQAFQNAWFASETYLLLGVPTQSKELITRAEKLGVGILHTDQTLSRPQMNSRAGQLPVSYASWLFNEWVWKHTTPMEN